MKLKLENLRYEKDAINAIVKSFKGIDKNSNFSYSNPLIKHRYDTNAKLTPNIDIKMTTGTGKTFVYTQMMYELNWKYGLFKFILLVPSPAIKEGSKTFMTSQESRRYFKQYYGHVNLDVHTINAGDFNSKSGRKYFPSKLSTFINTTHQNNQIEVLIINADMLRTKNMQRDDYDQTLLNGFTCPMTGLKAIKPVVIIDEPQRFPRNKKYYKYMTRLHPQMVVRFGATFPKLNGKTDFYRGYPQYNLNIVKSFNKNLIKAIDVYYPDFPENKAINRLKVSFKNRNKTLCLTNVHNHKYTEIDEGEPLKVTGGIPIKYEGEKKLSNGLILAKDQELVPGTFTTNYQNRLIKDAINKHFNIEQENFIRGNNLQLPKIKTITLFFIDSIDSYGRKKKAGEGREYGWLAKSFTKLLNAKLESLIDKYQYKSHYREKEYLQYLIATKKSLNSHAQKVHAGYFSDDRSAGKNNKVIQDEVDDILKNKKKMLTFKDNNNWNLRRFIFSKWTLREGWDNPNVFVIAKLRTSGSEISKFQEVGRGLRIPVDEFGNRVNDQEFRLAFLVGYDEKDFAKKLTNEANEDNRDYWNSKKFTSSMSNLITKNYPSVGNKNNLFASLINKGIINYKGYFKEHGIERLTEKYSILNTYRFNHDKVVNRNKQHGPKTKVKLVKRNWNKIKPLWNVLSNNYMIKYKNIRNLDNIILDTLNNKGDLFTTESYITNKNSVDVKNNKVVMTDTQEEEKSNVIVPYGKFIEQISKSTKLPIFLLHRCIYKYLINKYKSKQDVERYLNISTINNICNALNNVLGYKLINNYDYEKLNFLNATNSIYNINTNTFSDYVNASWVGTESDKNYHEDYRYLYKTPPIRYDSIHPEKQLLKINYKDPVVVFGKLPRNSIRIPKFDGGTTTPDFVYFIKTKHTKCYLLVETKAPNMRKRDRKSVV